MVSCQGSAMTQTDCACSAWISFQDSLLNSLLSCAELGKCALYPASLKLWAFLCWLISPQLEAGVRKGERQPRVAAISCWGRRTALSHGVPLQTGLGADHSSSWKAARTFCRAFSPLPRSTFTFALTWIWLRAAVRCIYMARCQRSSLGTGKS